jgi:tetratricopeptide (TPR) repeat protein
MKVPSLYRVAASVIVGLSAAFAVEYSQAQPSSAGSAEGPAVAKVPEMEEAAKIFRSGDYDGAMRALQAATKKSTDMAPPEVILAGWFFSANQAAMAREASQRAIATVPNDPEPYQILGEIAIRNREVAEAALLFEKALSLTAAAKEPNPRLTAIKRRALLGRASIAQSRQDWAGAQTQLEALLADDPKNSAALQVLGQVLFMQKKEDLALEKLRESAKLNDTLLGAEATLAQLYHQAGDEKNAGKWMLEAIKAGPRDAKTRIAAAHWSYDISKLDQAEEQAKAAVQLDPESLDAQLIRGAVALMRKDFKTAQEFYEKAHLRAPSNLMATNNLALALASQDEESKKRLGLEYAQINARLYPDQAEPLSTFGWALYRLGRSDEAMAALNKAASLPRATPDTIYFFARVLADRGRRDDAKLILQQSPVMKSPAPYLMRKEAEMLLEELSGR